MRSWFWILPTLLLSSSGDPGGGLMIDHRYAPERQYTLLCFPYDWQKTILLGNGNLAYDFGPGPYHAPETEIGFTIAGTECSILRQYFPDPAIPIAVSEIGAGTMTIRAEAFAIVPSTFDVPSIFRSGRVTRTGHLAGTIAWSGTAGDSGGAFRNVAWGTNRPVTYRVAVPPGSRKLVALGVCEAYKSGPGQRVLDLRVEGAESRIFDPRKAGKKNVPHVLLFDGRDTNADGAIAIEAHCAPESPDPNVILSAFWVFPAGATVSAESLAAGNVPPGAEVSWECGTELARLSPVVRHDALTASFEGPEATPALTITTRRPVTYDARTGIIAMGTGMSIGCFPFPAPGTSAQRGDARRWTFLYPHGTRKAEITIACGSGKDDLTLHRNLGQERARAEQFWKTQTTIPRSKIQVPDQALQSILDVNIRNLYQAADMVEGAPVFQPGPTVYRGLFFLDAMMIGEPLMLLGDTASVRKYLEGTFRYQQPDGRVRVAAPYNSYLETPVFVYVLGWYARRTNNRTWMEAQWSRMVRGIGWMERTRASTMRNPAAPNFGLFPAGFVDGGLAGSVADFSTASFALAALEEASGVAAWLGHPKEESAWRAQFVALMESYTTAARKSIRTDRFGNRFLPVAIGDTSTTSPPQRGQYGFFMPLRYAQYPSHPDPFIDSLITGNLAMLDSALQEGMVADAGWTKDAVWSWFAAMHATTLSWRGMPERATAMVYAVANHSGQLGTWVEEQQIRGKGTHSTGDGANAETSAYFITAVCNLLAVERDSAIEILPGVPAGWFRPGARTALDQVPVAGGRLTVEARVSADGTALRVSAGVADTGPAIVRRVILHTRALARAGFLLRDGSVPDGTLTGICAPQCTWEFTKTVPH